MSDTPSYYRPVDLTRHHREKLWDYHGRAIYHITLTTADRYPLFGVLFGDTAESASISLNPFGKEVNRMLHDLPAFFAPKAISLKTLAVMVMPDHLHLVLQVLEPMPKSIGKVIRSFKSACTSLFKRTYVPVFPAFAPIFEQHPTIWESTSSGYHEHILHCENQLTAMIKYVKDNPRRLWLKLHNPNLFQMHTQVIFGDWSFRAMGNMHLLDAPIKQVLQCSRGITPEYLQELQDTFLEQAQSGVVTLSAAISPGEKQIARLIRESHLPLVILLKDGFPPAGSSAERLYKPGGMYFDACAEGYLLLLEPTADIFGCQEVVDAVYRRSPMATCDSQRYHFLALNHIASRLASISE